MLVLRHPAALRRVDRILEAGDQRGRGEARFERGGVDERLERGARLPAGLDGAVEAALGEGAAADHHPDLARARIHGDDAALQVGRPDAVLDDAPDLGQELGARLVLVAGALLDRHQAGLERPLGGLLHRRIDRRVDAQPAARDAAPAEAIDQLAPDLLLEVLAERLVALQAVLQVHRRVPGAIERGPVDLPVLEHRRQDDVAAGHRLVHVDGGRPRRRRLDDAGDQRRFLDGQVGGRLGEVAARRRLDAVEAVAEVDLVQVELEDLLLGIGPLDQRGEDGFLDLAGQAPLEGQEALARQLLRQRRAALGEAPALQVDEDRAHDADHVDAAMVVEALILDRQHRVDEVRRHLRQRHLDALFLEDREDRAIGDVVEDGRLRHVAHAADLAAARQGMGDVVGEPGDGGDQEPRHGDGGDQRRPGQPRMGQGGQPHAIGRTPAQLAGALRRACHERWQGESGAHRRVITIIRGDGHRCPKTCVR